MCVCVYARARQTYVESWINQTLNSNLDVRYFGRYVISPSGLISPSQTSSRPYCLH